MNLRPRPNRRAIPIVVLAVFALSLGGCPADPPPIAGPTLPVSAPAAKQKLASPGMRLDVRVTRCIPIGYGVSCTCELEAPYRGAPARARLQACVGSSDRIGLYRKLEAAPLAAGGTPLSLWLEVEPASARETLCDILVLDSGERLQVVDSQR